MPKIKYNYKNRICEICNNSYTPTGTKQKSCSTCKTAFRKKSMPGWRTTYYKNHPDKNKITQQEYFQKHPEMHRYWGIKKRCKDKGLPFDLEPEDVISPDFCPILGIPLFRNVGGNRPTANSPSVDRLIPSLGYIKSNIQVISQRANIMKNDASPEELLKFADWIYKNYKDN